MAGCFTKGSTGIVRRDEIWPPVKWHPILSLREYAPLCWVLLVVDDRVWALVDAVRIGDERGYRVIRESDRALIGHYRNLKAAAEHAHQDYLSTLTPKGNPSNLHDQPHRAAGKANTPARTERD